MKYEDLELRTLKGNKVIIKSPEEGSEIGVIGGAWIEGLGETNASTLGFCSGASLRAWSSFKRVQTRCENSNGLYFGHGLNKPVCVRKKRRQRKKPPSLD